MICICGAVKVLLKDFGALLGQIKVASKLLLKQIKERKDYVARIFPFSFKALLFITPPPPQQQNTEAVMKIKVIDFLVLVKKSTKLERQCKMKHWYILKCWTGRLRC